jgi:hypothetical protein
MKIESISDEPDMRAIQASLKLAAKGSKQAPAARPAKATPSSGTKRAIALKHVLIAGLAILLPVAFALAIPKDPAVQFFAIIGVLVIGCLFLAASINRHYLDDNSEPLETAIVPWKGPRMSWTKLPLYPVLDHGTLLRSITNRLPPKDPYWYAFTLASRDPRKFVKEVKLAGRVAFALSISSPEAWANTVKSSWCGTWRLGFSAATTGGMDEAKRLWAAISGQITSANWVTTNVPWINHVVPFVGAEIPWLFSVPKEIAPDVPIGPPVEVHAPKALPSDIILGKVIDAETMRTTIDTGLLAEHLRSGLAITGGVPIEQQAILKIILSQVTTLPVVVLDDGGAFGIEGANVIRPGNPATINPLVPAGRTDTASFHSHSTLLVAALAAIHGWDARQEARLDTMLQEAIEKAVAAGKEPQVSDVLEDIEFEKQSPEDREIATALTQAFQSWARPAYGLHDIPTFDAAMLSGRATVFDLSHIHGTAKQACKAILAIKVAEAAKFTGRQVLLVIPDLDLMLADNRIFVSRTSYARQATAIMEFIAGSGASLAFTCQSPNVVPDGLLQRFGCVMSFRQTSKVDIQTVSEVLGLENEQLYGHSRHASYQSKYLAEMRPGMVFLRRPDVQTSFLIAVDIKHGAALIPPIKGPSNTAPATRPGTGLLETLLRRFGSVLPAVTGILRHMADIKDFGIKKGSFGDLAEIPMEAAIKEREPGLSAKDLKARTKAKVSELYEALIKNGILVADGYNATGLKDDVTVKLSAFGQQLLDAIGPTTIATESFSAGIKKRMRDGRTTMSAFADSRAYDDLARFLIGELEEVARLIKENGRIAIPERVVRSAIAGLDHLQGLLVNNLPIQEADVVPAVQAFLDMQTIVES